EQGPLGAFQYLDVFQVEGGHDGGAVGQGNIRHVDHHGGRAVADGYTLQAAHGNVGVHAATGGDHPQAGGQVGEILQIDDALLLDLHGTECGDRDRHGLGTFIAAAGGDHDFVQGANSGDSFNLSS